VRFQYEVGFFVDLITHVLSPDFGRLSIKAVKPENLSKKAKLYLQFQNKNLCFEDY
jgi:hypothetical protein